MSPVDSLSPPFSLPEPAPPGVVWKIAWPNSWPTTSIGVAWRRLSCECPKCVEEPSQYALTSLRPTLARNPPPAPSMPLRPSQSPSIFHSVWTL